jgi:hypothetical protein
MSRRTTLTGGVGVMASPQDIWSDILYHRALVEAKTRQAITERLQESITACTRAGYPELFLQGMARALETLAMPMPMPSEDPDGQQRLF